MFVHNFLVFMSLILTRIGYLSSGASPIAAFSTTRIFRGTKINSTQFAYSSCKCSLARSKRSSSWIISSWSDTIPLSSLFASNTEEEDPGKVDGTDLYIRKYPHPCLRAVNAEVSKEEIESGDISKLTKEMFIIMYATNGCGLAAPQVGINKRLMVYNVSGDPKRWLDEVVMINPTIVEFSEGKDIENEGCLSFPKLRGDVERSKWIKVEALNLKGKTIKKKFVGWDARVFQHEYDHLDGVVCTDRMNERSKVAAKNQLDQWIAEFGENGAI